jgi:kynurenine formamidase
MTATGNDGKAAAGAAPQPAMAAVGPPAVLEALGIPRSGTVYDLGTDLSRDMPQGSPDTFGGFRLTQYRTPQALTRPDDPPPFDFSMELISGSPHLGSHIDGLAHIQSEGKIFGGHLARDAYSDFGWTRNGIETTAPILARGVLLDIAGSQGAQQLPDQFDIGPAELEACSRRQGTELRRGDVVLVRTGKIAEFKAGSNTYFGAQPGVGPAGALWLYDRGMVVLGTDTSGIEPHPILNAANTTHKAMIVERGVYLLEILDLDGLAADRVFEFLFVCLPLRVVGGTGSWVRPIAVV